MAFSETKFSFFISLSVPEPVNGLMTPLLTGNKYVVGIRMTIVNVQRSDTATYKCIANNNEHRTGSTDERDILVEVN